MSDRARGLSGYTIKYGGRYGKAATNLTPGELREVDEIAKAEGVRRSVILRRAVVRFLQERREQAKRA